MSVDQVVLPNSPSLFNVLKDSSNYERYHARWVGNILYMGTEALGVGMQVRDIIFQNNGGNATFGGGMTVKGNVNLNGTTGTTTVNNLVINGSTTGTGVVSGVYAVTPLASTGGSAPSISIQQSSTSQSGYLSYTDWTTFNNKVSTAAMNAAFASPPAIGNTARNTGAFTGVNVWDTTGTTVLSVSDLSNTSGSKSMLRLGAYDSNGFATTDAVRIWSAAPVSNIASLNFAAYNTAAPTAAQMTLQGGNLGLGGTPFAWSGLSGPALDIIGGGGFSANGNTLIMAGNLYYTGGNWKYKATAGASMITANPSILYFYTSPSGTAGTTAALTNIATMSTSGMTLGTGSFNGDGGGLTGYAPSLLVGNSNNIKDQTGGGAMPFYSALQSGTPAVLWGSNDSFGHTYAFAPNQMTVKLANGVNQYPNRTDGAWYQAVWSNATGGDTNLYSTANVSILSSGYGAIRFGGSWTLEGNASSGLYSNTGFNCAGYLSEANNRVLSMAHPYINYFYDADNTAYYWNGNNDTHLNTISSAGTITAGSSIISNGALFAMRAGGGGDVTPILSASGGRAQFCGVNLANNVFRQAELGGGGASWTITFTQDAGTISVFDSGNLYVTGNVIPYWSDGRLKMEKERISDWKDIIRVAHGYRFKYNEYGLRLQGKPLDTDTVEVGLLTEELDEIYPQATIIQEMQYEMKESGIKTPKEGINYDPAKPYRTIIYDKMIPVLMEAANGTLSEVEELQAEVALLKEEIKSIKVAQTRTLN